MRISKLLGRLSLIGPLAGALFFTPLAPIAAQERIGKTSLASIARARCEAAQRAADKAQDHDVSTRQEGDVALVGVVRDAATTLALDSVRVFAQWINLSLDQHGIKRELVMRAAQTDRDGVYVLCAVPGGGTLFEWAERASATTGTIILTMFDVTTRFDLSIDLNAHAMAANDSAGSSSDAQAGQFRPVPVGNAYYRAQVQDPGGHPVPRARARTLGHNYAASDERGIFTLDSLPRGTATLEVQAIGYLPERRVITVGGPESPHDTIVLTSLKSVLDTIRITTGRDATGFDARRRGTVGEFITAADIERENPVSTTALLRSRAGVGYDVDQNGLPFLTVPGGVKKCSPYIFIDGFPPAPAPREPGMSAMDWQIHLDEIGGVEIYLYALEVPPELARWIFGPVKCGVIELWTRERLGLPAMPKTARP